MIKTNLNFSSNFSDKFLEEIKTQRNSGTIGYYNLPEVNIDSIKNFAKNCKKKHIIVAGIGGSSLGPLSIYEFLKPVRSFEKTITFIDTTDPLTIEYRLKDLDLNKAIFLIISKSGDTVETLAAFKYFLSKVPLNTENYALISDKSSKLHQFGENNNLKTFFIPKNVGGRFSVLSAVGLLPSAILGINIDALLEGAKEVRENFFTKGELYRNLSTKAAFYAKNSDNYPMNCLFSYTHTLKDLNAWFVQIWGESLGKIKDTQNVGLTPIGLVGPTDQHSFLQLIMEGPRDKTVTFIKLGDFQNKITIPSIRIKHFESLDDIHGLSFAQLCNMQADSTYEALKNLKNVPLDSIELPQVDEKSIAGLMMYFELLTSLTALNLGINAYDQPSVEAGKIILKEKLSQSDK